MQHSELLTKPVPSNPPGTTITVRPNEQFSQPGRLYTARRFNTEASALARIAPTLPRSTVMRSGGIRSLTNAVGYVGPNAALQRNSPRLAAAMRDNPDFHDYIIHTAEALWNELRTADPEAAHANETAAERINPDWLIGKTPWTSGVLNHGAALPYHNDNNNVPGTWSGMLWARHPAVHGGHLHIPELDLILECNHGQAVYFPGHSFLHGVSPMRDHNPKPNPNTPYRRWSLVFYIVNVFLDQPSAKDSLTEAKQRRTNLEDTLLTRQRENGLIK